MDDRVLIASRNKDFVSSPPCSDRVWCPSSLRNGYRKIFPRE